MSSLTETALISKKAFFWVLVVFAVSIAVLVFFGIGKSITKALFPQSAAPALVAFGKLTPSDFSSGYRAPGGATYELQTVKGGLPNLLTEAKAEIDAVGANAAVTGKEERLMSGRALLARQSAGQTEIGPLFDVLRFWQLRMFRKVWNRIH